ncbi:MAG: DNA repair protein RecO [Lachnospiraceae bacterium]|nr:DNA repair protein RecO [Lachnospiraceae bacterium]
MQDLITVQGMVLQASPVGEYDKRVVLLSRERGKITVFARGSRRMNSRFMAAVSPIAFGSFQLFEGRTAYNLMHADVSNYFEGLRNDMEKTCYATYFLEVADYYTRENLEAEDMLGLLYLSMRALESDKLENRLVRCIFEMRSMVINGEFPGLPGDREYEESTRYAVDYIQRSPVEKLYTFAVSPEVLTQLEGIAARFISMLWDRKFKSLEILKEIIS